MFFVCSFFYTLKCIIKDVFLFKIFIPAFLKINLFSEAFFFIPPQYFPLHVGRSFLFIFIAMHSLMPVCRDLITTAQFAQHWLQIIALEVIVILQGIQGSDQFG